MIRQCLFWGQKFVALWPQGVVHTRTTVSGITVLWDCVVPRVVVRCRPCIFLVLLRLERWHKTLALTCIDYWHLAFFVRTTARELWDMGLHRIPNFGDDHSAVKSHMREATSSKSPTGREWSSLRKINIPVAPPCARRPLCSCPFADQATSHNPTHISHNSMRYWSGSGGPLIQTTDCPAKIVGLQCQRRWNLTNDTHVCVQDFSWLFSKLWPVSYAQRPPA